MKSLLNSHSTSKEGVKVSENQNKSNIGLNINNNVLQKQDGQRFLNQVSVIMGSKSDYETMKHCEEILRALGIRFETLIISAHRTPHRMFDYSKAVKGRGIKVVIAAAGGAAHLPGMVASITDLPVIGVPIKSSILNGVDSLLSIVQMPFGVPVATVAIGEAGAKNAAILAAKMLAIYNEEIALNVANFTSKQTKSVPITPAEQQSINI